MERNYLDVCENWEGKDRVMGLHFAVVEETLDAHLCSLFIHTVQENKWEVKGWRSNEPYRQYGLIPERPCVLGQSLMASHPVITMNYFILAQTGEWWADEWGQTTRSTAFHKAEHCLKIDKIWKKKKTKRVNDRFTKSINVLVLVRQISDITWMDYRHTLLIK